VRIQVYNECYFSRFQHQHISDSTKDILIISAFLKTQFHAIKYVEGISSSRENETCAWFRL